MGVIALMCRLADMRRKEVISTRDGSRLGCVGDIELDTENAQLSSIIVYGRSRLFGLLGRGEDLVIPWQQIETIGEDVILVNCPVQDLPPRPEEDGLRAIFHNFVSS